MNYLITCCRNCPKKGCGAYHDICPDYLKQKAEQDKTKSLMTVSSIMVEYKQDLSTKILRKKHNSRRK